MAKTAFSNHLLKWFDQHGRKNLPWQKNLSGKTSDKKTAPYRVWLSEIMLQQTQVATVIPYFEKFIKQFPTVDALAAAPLDEVLHLWSGLGYYARARNLHKAAKMVVEQYNSRFPDTVDTLSTLPGIGASTAGAIISIAFKKRAVILDGNVKRVLGRHYAVDGSPNNSKTIEHYWQLAEKNTPQERVNDYTQAIMDLGATLCTRSKPRCPECPLKNTCIAYKQGNPEQYPVRKIKKAIPTRSVQMLLIVNAQGEVLLQQRPPQGIWGGLWSFPEIPENENPANWCRDQKLGRIQQQTLWPARRHTFSHFHLMIQPVLLELSSKSQPRTQIMDGDKQLWYKLASTKTSALPTKGLAAPVSKLLKQLKEDVLHGPQRILQEVPKRARRP